MEILHLISAGNYIAVHKPLIKLYGADGAILIGHFASLQSYFKGEFFSTYSEITAETGLPAHIIRKVIHILTSEGIIERNARGMPKKVYYKITNILLQKILQIESNNSGNVTYACHYNMLPSEIKGFEYNNNNNDDEDVCVRTRIHTHTKDEFDIFWEKYPKKVNKGYARKAWEKLYQNKKNKLPKLRVILKALEGQIQSEQWTNPQYIPHPSTYLNNYGWENDPRKMINFQQTTSKTEIKTGAKSGINFDNIKPKKK